MSINYFGAGISSVPATFTITAANGIAVSSNAGGITFTAQAGNISLNNASTGRVIASAGITTGTGIVQYRGNTTQSVISGTTVIEFPIAVNANGVMANSVVGVSGSNNTTFTNLSGRSMMWIVSFTVGTDSNNSIAGISQYNSSNTLLYSTKENYRTGANSHQTVMSHSYMAANDYIQCIVVRTGGASNTRVTTGVYPIISITSDTL